MNNPQPYYYNSLNPYYNYYQLYSPIYTYPYLEPLSQNSTNLQKI
jgi:hypothetical protein